MQKSFCNARCIGRLGSDPEMSHTSGGTLLAEFTLAVILPPLHPSGQETVQWQHAKAFNKTAEVIRDYVKAGCLVYVDGPLRDLRIEDPRTGKARIDKYIAVKDFSILTAAPRTARIGPVATGRHPVQRSVMPGTSAGTSMMPVEDLEESGLGADEELPM